MSIATILNFCSNDYPFLEQAIQHVKPFSKQILIPVCDHFYDGVPENRQVLEAAYAEHPECTFIEFEYAPEENFYALQGRRMWHSMARMIGFYHLDPAVEYVLFLDTDEIVDTPAFHSWLSTGEYQAYEAMRLACYWYFRSPSLQALTYEDTPLLVRRDAWTADLLLHSWEREGSFDAFTGVKRRLVKGIDGLPMIHHYSWVRSREQMIRKAKSWGMHNAKDWLSLIEEEHRRPFNGSDFVHGYVFQEVNPFVKIDLAKKLSSLKGESVRRVTTRDFLRIDILLRC